jgi:Reverse transcriptase (RNA-dependent DNA polymerase)
MREVWEEGAHCPSMPFGKLAPSVRVDQWAADLLQDPIQPRTRTLSSLERGHLELAITRWLSQGYIEPSHAFVTCNPVFVAKKDGTIRTCIDYTPINRVIGDNDWPLPLIKDFRHRIVGATMFSRIDLKEAFHRIHVECRARPLTAFHSHRGKFQFTRMPFGLKTAPSVFQKFMDWTLRKHGAYALWFIDDVLVFSADDSHTSKLQAVRTTLANAGVTINEDKSAYHKRELTYVGLSVSAKGIGCALDATRLAEWPMPRTRTEKQSFLGFANCFRDYVPRYATHSAGMYPKKDELALENEIRNQSRLVVVESREPCPTENTTNYKNASVQPPAPAACGEVEWIGTRRTTTL